jgi:hypothetical protein
MSEDQQNDLQPENPNINADIGQKIALLRQQLLADAMAWPASADALFDNLAASSETAEDDAMLAMIAQDALQGVDISRKYPSAYRRILSSERIQEAFLDLLEALEFGARPELPMMPAPKLDFLQTAVTTPQLTLTPTSTGWQVTWKLRADYLSSHLTQLHQHTPNNNPVTLLNETTPVDGQLWHFLLTGTPQPHSPTHWLLALTVDIPPSAPQLEARILWGNYDATLTIPHQESSPFPPIDHTPLFDPSTKTTHSDLYLLLKVEHPSFT